MSAILSTEVEVIKAASLDGLPHGFLGRRGGVSRGIVTGLNVGWGSGDDPDAIAENRRLAVEAIMDDYVSRLRSTQTDDEIAHPSRSSRAQSRDVKLVTVHQIHSHYVVEAGDWPDDKRPHADALVTDKPGVLLGILTADCAPILLADREAGVVGAAHAGWRGALTGVAEATVAAMEKLGANRERIAAAIGPAIAQRSFEVDESFRAGFGAYWPDAARFFSDGPAGKPHFDLEGYLAFRLAAAGIRKVEALGLDTYAEPDRFYSYRRATHRAEPDYGRQVSLIGLPG